MRTLPLLLCLTACGAGPLGQVHPEFADAARGTPSIVKAGVYLGKKGQIRSLAVYHTDASAIPAAVIALGKTHFADATVKYYETEWCPDAGQVYEIEYDLGEGRSGEISARADGSLVYVEKPIDPKALPPKVAQAALQAVRSGTITRAEHQLGPKVEHYGVKVEQGGRLHVVLVKPDGHVVRHSLRVPAQLEVPIR